MTTASNVSTSVYAHLYLGDPETDPAPVFRDLSPEGARLPDGTLVAWPEGAVFGVYFAPEEYPMVARRAPTALGLRFYDTSGWPQGFPKDRIEGLPPAARVVFQERPARWWVFTDFEWATLVEDPRHFSRRHFGARVAHRVARSAEHTNGFR